MDKSVKKKARSIIGAVKSEYLNTLATDTHVRFAERAFDIGQSVSKNVILDLMGEVEKEKFEKETKGMGEKIRKLESVLESRKREEWKEVLELFSSGNWKVRKYSRRVRSVFGGYNKVTEPWFLCGVDIPMKKVKYQHVIYDVPEALWGTYFTSGLKVRYQDKFVRASKVSNHPNVQTASRQVSVCLGDYAGENINVLLEKLPELLEMGNLDSAFNKLDLVILIEDGIIKESNGDQICWDLEDGGGL